VQLPWWILTDYPDNNDQMSLLDGAVLLLYIGATALVIGGAVSLCLFFATASLGAWSPKRYHHLAQSLIPIAGCGVFLGLGGLTVSMLRAEGFALAFIGVLRAFLLAGAACWSIALAWQIAGRATTSVLRRLAAAMGVACAVLIGAASWLLLWVW